MVVYCKVPYGTVARWCSDQGCTELPTSDHKPSSGPLLIVDNRIMPSYHEEYTSDMEEIRQFIKKAKGRNIYFGLRINTVDYIGDQSLVVWSKK